MTVQYFTSRIPVFCQVQWGGSNFDEVQSCTSITLTDNGDGTLSFPNMDPGDPPPTVVNSGQWLAFNNKVEPPSITDSPVYTSDNAQPVPDAGPFDYTVTEAGTGS